MDFQKTDRKSIMKQWDYWRREIADGDTGSAPRDWFEAILDYYDEKFETSHPPVEEDCTCDGKIGNNDIYCPIHCQPCYKL